MSELQIALALIGVLAVIGIVIYNRMQERKFRRQAESGFSPPGEDVLLDAEPMKEMLSRVDPDFHETLIKDPIPRGFHGRADQEPHFGDTEILLEAALSEDNYQSNAAVDEPLGEPGSHVQPDAPDVSPYDESIEYRAVVKNLEGMAAGKFGDFVSRSASLGRTVRWIGLPPGSLSWEALSPQSEKKYLEVQAIMQLADREGAAEKDRFVALCELTQELAHSEGWQVRCDDPAEAAVRAQSLDKFCAEVDVQIGLNIVARGTAILPIARIRHEAESVGMRLGYNGAYQLLDSRGETLFMLGNREPRAFSRENAHEPETKGVTLLFDVPRVPDGLKNFDNMVKLGRKLAHDAGGLLVDDNLRPLTDTGIEKIRAQLAQIYSRMEARGLPAGSRLALRLFS